MDKFVSNLWQFMFKREKRESVKLRNFYLPHAILLADNPIGKCHGHEASEQQEHFVAHPYGVTSLQSLGACHSEELIG